jgi:hypothetical protein
MSKHVGRTEFETHQEFEKRKLDSVKEIDSKKNALKNQVYRLFFTYTDNIYLADCRAFSLENYNLEKGVFPISINTSKWKCDFSWDNDTLQNLETFPLVLSGMPENIVVPIDIAKKIRKKDTVKLEVDFRVTSCRDEYMNTRPKRYGFGTVWEKRATIEAQVISVRLLN